MQRSMNERQLRKKWSYIAVIFLLFSNFVSHSMRCTLLPLFRFYPPLSYHPQTPNSPSHLYISSVPPSPSFFFHPPSISWSPLYFFSPFFYLISIFPDIPEDEAQYWTSKLARINTMHIHDEVSSQKGFLLRSYALLGQFDHSNWKNHTKALFFTLKEGSLRNLWQYESLSMEIELYKKALDKQYKMFP